MSKTTAFPCTQTDCEYGILLPLVMNIIVGPTIVIKVFLLRHRLWMPICLKIILFLLHCSEKATFLLSFIYTCDIIWPPAPFESCYQARNLKEVARAWFSVAKSTTNIGIYCHLYFRCVTDICMNYLPASGMLLRHLCNEDTVIKRICIVHKTMFSHINNIRAILQQPPDQ